MNSAVHDPGRQVDARRAKSAPGRDHRLRATLALVLGIAVLGSLVNLLPGRGVDTSAPPAAGKAPSPFADLSANREPQVPAKPEAEPERPALPASELAQALKKAAAHNAAGQHDDAIRTMNSVHSLAGGSAQAYLQIGRALLGKKDFATARDFLSKAIDLDPTLAEAYFDHATASDGLGDLESALGGMRSYLHLEKNSDPYRLKIAQARSAIWEWESQLGRGAWGPTKGIPPGFKAEDFKRDGKGVGTFMPKPETLRPDGTMDYEIKAGKRFPELWKK